MPQGGGLTGTLGAVAVVVAGAGGGRGAPCPPCSVILLRHLSRKLQRRLPLRRGCTWRPWHRTTEVPTVVCQETKALTFSPHFLRSFQVSDR